MKVAAIGQCSWDLVAIVPDHPPVDTKVDVLEWHEDGGGPAATAAVALSRFGVVCAFAGVCGNDVTGERITYALAEEGVDVGALKVREGFSQLAFVSVERESGKRTIFCRRPTAADLLASELPDDFLDGKDFLLLDGTMPDASIAAATEARRRGIPVMIDAGSLRPGVPEMIRLANYVVGPQSFFHRFGWDGTGAGMEALRRQHGNTIMTVTLGEKGSLTWGDGFIEMPAFPVRAIDTTGAGDVFHGGYIYGLLRAWGLRQTLQFASAAAAMSCMQPGGRRGIPSVADAIDFIRHQRGEECRWGF